MQVAQLPFFRAIPMLRRSLAFRIMAPQILLSLTLLSLCIGAAAYLYHQQTRSFGEIRENVDSREIAEQLANAVTELTKAVSAGDARAAQAWRDRVSERLVQAWDYADKEEERHMVGELKSRFDQFDHEPTPQGRLEILNEALLPTAAKLRDFNLRQIETSSRSHSDSVVLWLAWGLAAVGGIGSIAGLVFGYGMAKALRHSIYQLSVRVRDAADKLGQDLPTVTLEEHGDLHHLHDQLQVVIHDIEQVV